MKACCTKRLWPRFRVQSVATRYGWRDARRQEVARAIRRREALIVDSVPARVDLDDEGAVPEEALGDFLQGQLVDGDAQLLEQIRVHAVEEAGVAGVDEE